MHSIVRHVCLERRRLTLIGVLSFAAGFTLYSHIDVTRMGLSVPLITGLIYMAVIVLATSISTFFLPGLRRVTDTVAVTRLGFALWVTGTQSYEIASSPLISASIVVGGAILLLQIGTRLQVAAEKLSQAESNFGFFKNAQAFLIWLDNTPEYHAANVKPAFSLKLRRVHG